MTKKRYIPPTSDPFVADVRLAIKKLELKRKPCSEQEKVESQLNHGLPPLGSSWHEYPEWFRVAYNDLRSQEYSGGGSQ